MDQKYSADSGAHADSHATRASLMPNLCVDSFVYFRSGNFVHKWKQFMSFLCTLCVRISLHMKKDMLLF